MARTNAQAAPQVPLDLWRELYQAAATFQLLGPWRWMNGDDVLGISNDHGARLLTVLGSMGEVFGLASSQGSTGANFLLRLRREEFTPENREAAFYQDALLVDFVPRKELQKQDRAIVNRLQFQPVASRPRLYPKFSSYRPGYAPWFLDEVEARSLLDDLQKVARFAGLLRVDLGFHDSHPEDEVPFFPALATEPLTLDQFEWHTLSPAPPPADPPVEPQTLSEAMLLRRPQTLETVWELAAFYSHLAISEGPRPYFPKMALVVDARAAVVLGFQLGTPQQTMAEVAACALAKSIEATGRRPAAIKVGSVNLFRALQPLAGALGARLIQASSLPMMGEARRSLDAYSGQM